MTKYMQAKQQDHWEFLSAVCDKQQEQLDDPSERITRAEGKLEELENIVKALRNTGSSSASTISGDTTSNGHSVISCANRLSLAIYRLTR